MRQKREEMKLAREAEKELIKAQHERVRTGAGIIRPRSQSV